MKTIDIKAEKRDNVGKKDTVKLREKLHVPCVLYGGKEVVHFHAHENDFRHVIYTPNAYIVNLSIDGKDFKATMQEIQFHPITDKLLHIDFIEVFDDKPVTIEIPVRLFGLAEGVKQGGKLNLLQRRLKIRGLIKDLPDTLDINVENITLGKTVKVEELDFDNLQILNPKSDVVLSVKLTRAATSASDEEGEEGEEREEGEEETAEE